MNNNILKCINELKKLNDLTEIHSLIMSVITKDGVVALSAAGCSCEGCREEHMRILEDFFNGEEEIKNVH